MEQKTKASLVEPGVRYFINATLKKCNDTKNIYYNHIITLSLCSVMAIFYETNNPVVCKKYFVGIANQLT